MKKKETSTKIKWDCKRLSKDDFNLSTNKFTPTIPGRYLISAGCEGVKTILLLYY